MALILNKTALKYMSINCAMLGTKTVNWLLFCDNASRVQKVGKKFVQKDRSG